MVNPGIPEAGCYQVKFVRHGPWVPVRIAYQASQPDRSPIWIVERGGKFVDVFDVWPECSGNRISEAEYAHLMTILEWSKVVRTAPEANPFNPIDHHSLKPIF